MGDVRTSDDSCPLSEYPDKAHWKYHKPPPFSGVIGWGASSADVGRAALAAIADAPGLAEVLDAHRGCGWREVWDETRGTTCGMAAPARIGPTFIAAHLADVVRAWLRGGL